MHTLSGTASISTLHDDADYDDDALSTIMMIERLALPGPDGGTTSMQANASGSLEGVNLLPGGGQVQCNTMWIIIMNIYKVSKKKVFFKSIYNWAKIHTD